MGTEPLNGSLAARDLERVWMVRAMSAISGITLSLGFVWMQNTYDDQRGLRSDFVQLQLSLATMIQRMGDVREINATQDAEIRSLRATISDLRLEVAKYRGDKP